MNAQTVGVYGGTFFSGWKTYGFSREYMFGPSGGVFVNGFLKGSFNPGLDFQYSQNRIKHSDKNFNVYDYPFYNFNDSTNYSTEIEVFKSVKAFTLDLEFSSAQEDTLIIAIGLQPGISYLSESFEFSNPNIPDLNFNRWVPSFGGSGTVRINYLFGTPLQFFTSLSYQGYLTSDIYLHKMPINTAFQGGGVLTVAYAKLGLAYKFR